MGQARIFLDRAATARQGRRANTEGGDCAGHGSAGLLVRHVVNYLAAVHVAGDVVVEGPILDVGSGVGGLGAWAAARLGRDLHLVDHDPQVRAVAAEAFPDAVVHPDLSQAPQAAVVTAMEVLEHVRPAGQASFIAALVRRIAPGGVLVLSTPDESAYPGGWSGYAPHVGPVTFRELEALLQATNLPATVWRVNGPGFTLGPVGRLAEPLANRVWGGLVARAPDLAYGIETTVGRVAGMLPKRGPWLPPDVFRLDQDPDGSGTGLLGVVRMLTR